MIEPGDETPELRQLVLCDSNTSTEKLANSWTLLPDEMNCPKPRILIYSISDCYRPSAVLGEKSRHFCEIAVIILIDCPIF